MVYVVSHAQQAVCSSAPVNLPRVVPTWYVWYGIIYVLTRACGVSLEAARVWLSSLAGLAPATRSGGAAGWAGGGTARRGASPH